MNAICTCLREAFLGSGKGNSDIKVSERLSHGGLTEISGILALRGLSIFNLSEILIHLTIKGGTKELVHF